MNSRDQNQEKRTVVTMMMSEAATRVCFDARHDGVIVPKHLSADPGLVLCIGYDLPIPIRDLTLTDDAITGTLSFGGAPFYCVIPLAAVYRLDNGLGQWCGLMPDGTFEALRAIHATFPAPTAPDPAPKARGHLKLVN